METKTVKKGKRERKEEKKKPALKRTFAGNKRENPVNNGRKRRQSDGRR